MQDTPDGVGAHPRQAIRSTTQCSLQGGERPGSRLVILSIWFPVHLLENPFLLCLGVSLRLAAAMPLGESVDPISVEPRDPVGDSIATLPTGSTSRCLKAGTIRHGEHFL